MFELNRLYNLDCMEAMKEIPDKFFEVAITDPPYGIGIDGQRLNINKNPKHSRKASPRRLPHTLPFRRTAFHRSHVPRLSFLLCVDLKSG